MKYPVFKPTNGKNILLVIEGSLADKNWIVAEFDPKYCPEPEEIEVWGTWESYDMQNNMMFVHTEKEGNK